MKKKIRTTSLKQNLLALIKKSVPCGSIFDGKKWKKEDKTNDLDEMFYLSLVDTLKRFSVK